MDFPAKKWSWWKIILIPLVILGGFGALLTFYPLPSIGATSLAFTLTLIGMIGFAAAAKTEHAWTRVVYLNAWLLLFLAIGIRALSSTISVSVIWIVLLLGAYSLAWLLPYINPSLSSFLFKEQFNPQTKIGRGLLRISISALPIAGTLGTFVGMNASRLGQEDAVATLMGVISILVAIGGGQAFSHQVWKQSQMVETPAQETEEG